MPIKYTTTTIEYVVAASKRPCPRLKLEIPGSRCHNPLSTKDSNQTYNTGGGLHLIEGSKGYCVMCASEQGNGEEIRLGSGVATRLRESRRACAHAMAGLEFEVY